MTVNESPSTTNIDASCRVPLLALFSGAALWLVVSSALAVLASLSFHMPGKFGDIPFLTYGRVQPAADDALLYGFCIPAGLGVLLWIFARLGQVPLRGGIVPVVAAHLWHLGVLAGVVGILAGESTGFTWLEFPRGAAALLFVAYLLLALWAFMNFTGRRDRGLFPSHWFFVAALFVFPWIYSAAQLLLIGAPVRGVVQAAVAWWYGGNLVFLWTSLIGLGAAFYFLPKFSGRPLHSYFYALFAFWTLLLFGSLRGIPAGAPLPAWMPALSALNSLLLIVPILAIAVIGWKTVMGGAVQTCKGGSYCMIKFGFVAFLLSALLLVAGACPQVSRITQFTWFSAAQTQLHLYGFLCITLFGAIYYILPRAVGRDFAFPRLMRLQHWCSMLGIFLLVVSLAAGGLLQGIKLHDAGAAFDDSTRAMLPFLRSSTMGLLLMLLANLLFALNLLTLLFLWHLSVIKTVVGAALAPRGKTGVKA